MQELAAAEQSRPGYRIASEQPGVSSWSEERLAYERGEPMGRVQPQLEALLASKRRRRSGH